MFYLHLLFNLMPWALLVLGAAEAVRRRNMRTRRLQIEGAGLLIFGLVVKWAVYDPNFGLTRIDTPLWGYWFAYADAGMFWIGLLLFSMGLLLEAQPDRDETPRQPDTGKALHRAFILLGALLGLLTLIFSSHDWGETPFSAARTVSRSAFIPSPSIITGGAMAESGRNLKQKHDHIRAEFPRPVESSS
jgi:hypothetical protein